MDNFLEKLVMDAKNTVKSGYYGVGWKAPRNSMSLTGSINSCKHAPIIAEIKPSSPSMGKLRNVENVVEVAGQIERGGAVGISVLTEPKHFNGSLKLLTTVRQKTKLPLLMKDIIVDPVQINAGFTAGANAVLLIYSIFEKHLTEHSLEEMIGLAHSHGLQVILETNTREEFLNALETDADLIGINNRDLRTLKVDLKTTETVLAGIGDCRKIIVSESGIKTPGDIRYLRRCGARAFLVGTSIMLSENVKGKVRELVMAL